MTRLLNIPPTCQRLLARDLQVSGNKEPVLTTSLNVLMLAPQAQASNWLNTLDQAGFAIQLSRYDSLQAHSQAASTQSHSTRWQVALISDTLPGLESPDLPTLKALRYHYPALPVIFIASRADLQTAVAAIKAGAAGYLAESDLSALAATVREALTETERSEVDETTRKNDELRYRQMFRNNSAVKLLIDPATGEIVDANDAACRFYGYSRSELVKHNIDQINTLSPQEVKAEMANAESEQRFYFEFRHRLASGAICEVEVRSSPLLIDGRRLLYSVIHDITERKQMEKAQAFMVSISHLLTTTLDYRTVLKDVAMASVPFLADVCLVFLVQPDNSVKLQTLAAHDKSGEALFLDYFNSHPVSLTDDFGVGKVINTRPYRLVRQVTPESVTGSGLDFIEFACYRHLQINSILVVPLLLQNRLQGALAFIYTESGRSYSDIDARLAEGIARRVGLAIDNARHYEEARQAAASEMATRRELEKLANLLTHQAGELNAIIEAMPDGVLICDVSGKLTRLNPRAIDIFGLDRAGEPIAEYLKLEVYYPNGQQIPPEERPLAQALRGVTNTNYREMVYRRGSDQPVQIRASFAPILTASGEIRGGITIVSDITELQRLENQKDEFLTIASHELKTPITSIKGLTQLAIRRLKKAGMTGEIATLQKVEKQVDRLIELINDMLDTRRVQHGRLELQFRPFDFAALVLETAQALQSTTSNHIITVEVPPELIVTGDSHRLEQVLNNLLTNAIKYSPKGGPVEVTLEQRDGMAVVSVHDYGIGVPEKDRPNLFQPFHRASNVSLYEVAGFGLGLYLCSEIMKAHHGRLWLDNATSSLAGLSAAEAWDAQAANSGATPPPEGSTFCFSLPLNLPPS